MSIEIIRATPHQATTVSYIGRTAFRDAFARLFHKKIELEEYLDYTYAVEKVADSIQKENNVYYVALVDGLPAGFAKIKKHSLNEQLDSVFQSELQKIYVLKEYHGTGVGNRLMESIIHLVEELEPECLWLDTHVSNARAIHFYEKHGFKNSGRHHFTIGTQTFEYYLMALPVEVPCTC